MRASVPADGHRRFFPMVATGFSPCKLSQPDVFTRVEPPTWEWAELLDASHWTG
ncbi:MAG: hypothetical protein LUO89_12745 [Methanothrix sp.]|nr:hypothetical protein [Methanothrix sp.]